MTREDIVPAGLWTYGAIQLGQGAWMLVDPASFFDQIGPFGTRNDHYTRDAATWSIALGAALIIAAVRGSRSARGVILLFAVLQAGSHAINHIADAGIANPRWVGTLDALSLGAITAALLLLWRLNAAQPEISTPSVGAREVSA